MIAPLHWAGARRGTCVDEVMTRADATATRERAPSGATRERVRSGATRERVRSASAQLVAAPARHWMWVPLTIFLASRVVSTVLVLLSGQGQEPPPGVDGTFARNPSLGQLLASWDGDWYAGIAAEGYPRELPRADGAVAQNSWAFYPLLPALARMLMLTGLDFAWAASTVALTMSAAAFTLLFAMVRERTDDFTAALAVATLALGPIGLVFQASYTEGPALLLALLALRALGARRWGRLVVAGILLSFTRPITLPLAAVCGATWLMLWRRRGTDGFPVRDRLQLGASTVIIAASFLAWPAVAWLVTGEADAYRLTQGAWVDESGEWTTWLSGLVGRGVWEHTVVGVAALLLLVGVAARPAARAWPHEGRWWTVLYALYVLAATRPTSSTLRHLVLVAFPTWPVPDLSQRCRTVRTRVALALPVVAMCCLTQWWWVSTVWVTHGDRSYWP